MKTIMTLLLLFFVSDLAYAQRVDGKPIAPGWHFYEPTPVKKPKPPVTPVTPGSSSTPAPPLFSTAWLRTNLPVYLDRAMDNPTAQNIELYGLLQRLTLDKADRFASATTRQAMFNPLLDQSTRNPTTTVARNARNEAMTQAKKISLGKISQQAGLFYFFRSDCPYCHRQNPILKLLQERTGMTILPISLDGRPSPDGSFPNFKADQGQAARFGVSVTPTLVYVSRSGESKVLATGIRALPELESRLLEMGFTQGAISQQEYDVATRSSQSHLMNTDGLSAEQLKVASDNPALLLSLLRSGALAGGSSEWSSTTTSSNSP